MKASIRDVTPENVKGIPEPCKACLYWENPALKGGQSPAEKEQFAAQKAAWFLKTLKEFGNCGKIVCANSGPVGYAQYSCAGRLPNTLEYGAEKLETADVKVAFISCLYIVNESFRGKGFGEKLLDEIVTDLKKRGFKAVETFVRKGSSNNPSGPMQLYLKKGFYVKEQLKADPDFALVKMNL